MVRKSLVPTIKKMVEEGMTYRLKMLWWGLMRVILS